MKQGLSLLFLFLVTTVFAQLKKLSPEEFSLNLHEHGTICHIGEPKPGLIIPAPANSRNNQQEPLTFIPTFGPGIPTAAKTAFNRATTILANIFSSPVPVSVRVQFDELEPGSLAGASPGTYLQDFQNAPLRDTWYPIALAEKIARREFNSANAPYDIEVTVNKDIDWYYESTGIAANQFDFVTIILHELLHGMGFTGLTKLNGQQGTLLLQGFPSSYSQFVENGQNLSLSADFEDPSVNLGNQLKSNNLFIQTPSFANNGTKAKVYAPSVFSEGSSISHLDKATYSGTANTLMTPSVNPGAIIHNPGIAVDILYDLGWSMTNIIHEPGTGEEDVDKPYVVTATVVSDNRIREGSLQLHYSQDTFKTENILSLQATDNANEFQVTIPAPGKITKYQYYLRVEDQRGLNFTSPSEAPNPLFFEFFYANDETNPVIVHEAVETLDDKAGNLDLDASVTDFFTGVAQVWIDYRINNGTLTSISMDKDFSDGFRPDLYVGSVLLPENGLSENDELEYRIRAIDKSPQQNTITSPADNSFYKVRITKTLDAIRQYVNDFEIDENDFNGQGFSIAMPSGFTDQAIHSLHPYTNAGQNNTRNFIYNLRIPIIIRNADPLIEFEEIVLVEPGEPGTEYTDTEFWDYVIVEGRRTNSSNWMPFLPGYDSKADASWLNTYNSNISQQVSRGLGSPRLYRDRLIDMTENGNFVAGDTVLVRFRLFSDPFAVGWGWAIDNLRIQDSPVAVEDFLSPGSLQLFPNPAGEIPLTVQARFKQPVKDVQLTIYNLYGQEVWKQSYKAVPNLFTETISIQQLPKGIYYLSLQLNNEMPLSRKFLRH